MATKPTIADARWATDGAAELTAPSSGERDSGFVGGTAAVADYANVLHKEAYKWAQYLDDGQLSGPFGLVTAISPAAITGSNNDYAPTAFATAAVVRQDLSADATLTGLAGGAGGRVVTIVNLHATNVLTLAHDVTSTAANRFTLPEAKNLRLVGAGSYATLWYDATASRWRVIATNGRQEKTLIIPASAAQTSIYATAASNNFASPAGAFGSESSSDNKDFPVMLPVGTRIVSISAMINGQSAGPTKSLSLWRSGDDLWGTGPVEVTTADTTTGAAAEEILEILAINHVVLDDNAYSVTFDPGEAGDAIAWVKVKYD